MGDGQTETPRIASASFKHAGTAQRNALRATTTSALVFEPWEVAKAMASGPESCLTANCGVAGRRPSPG
jgi:hypothetical protein